MFEIESCFFNSQSQSLITITLGAIPYLNQYVISFTAGGSYILVEPTCCQKDKH